MKKLLLSLAVIISVLEVGAQGVIPNGTFEGWGTGGAGTQEPTTWTTTNNPVNQVLLSTNRGNVLKETTFFHLGATSVALVDSSYGVPLGILPGTMAAGTSTISYIVSPASLKITPGAAFINRPDSIEFYYAYVPVGGDSFTVSVLLSKWNASVVPQKRDTVAWAKITIGGNVSPTTFAQKKDSLMYMSYGAPDSLTLVVQSSAYPGGHAGTKLWIDDIAFKGIDSTKAPSGNGIATIVNEKTSITVYPNPAKQNVVVSYSGSSNSRFVLSNMLGQKVMDFKLSSAKMRFDVSALENGLYIYQVVSEQGETEHTGRFVVNK